MADRSEVWFAVINVYAASKQAAEYWKQAENYLKDKGFVYHGSRTGRGGNAMELAFDACMAGYRRFIAVGGDGTVHDVLNGIAGYIDWKNADGGSVSFSDFTLGVIPMGSGNDWIRTVGIPKDMNKSLDVLIAGNLSRQDVVKVSLLEQKSLPSENPVSVSYMANVGGVGIDARVCETVNAKKREGKRGKILYVTSLIKAIKERVPAAAKVYKDGELVFDGAYLSMAFGIGKYSGGGMRQTPDAVLDDGLLDVTIIPDIPLMRIALEAPRLFTGSFLKVPELSSFRGSVITVLPETSSCTEPVEVDGEVVGRAPVRFEIMDSQINIVTP